MIFNKILNFISNFKLKIFFINKKLLKYELLLIIILLFDALSIFSINNILNSDGINIQNYISFFIIIIASFSSLLQPKIIYKISKIIRNKIFLFVYGLNDLNYHSLESAIQKDEMIFFNLIVSDVSIAAKLLSIFTITIALLLTTENNLIPLLIIIPMTIFFYRKLTKKTQSNLSQNIASNFHDITEIRKLGSVLSKSIFFNKSYLFMAYIDKLYDAYYRDLAKQSSISNGYRTVIEISAYFGIMIIGYFSNGLDILKSLLLIGYSAVKILPIIQQLNFYISVRKNGKDQLELIKNSNLAIKSLDECQNKILYNGHLELLWIRGKSGAGKTTLIDSFANSLRLNNINFGYYVQNQYPLKIEINREENIDWAPNIKSIKSILEGRYSVGEIQRLAILDILSNESNKYLLLDEPFSSQSDNFIKSIVIYLKGLIKNGSKIVIISHVDISQYFENYQEIWCNYDRNNSRTN